MELISMKSTTIALLTGAIAACTIAAAPAQASLYRSPSGRTEMRMAEWNVNFIQPLSIGF
jgi:invasion protein IalB